MPVGVHPPRRENQHVPSSPNHRDAAEEERLVQLQQATQQNDRPGDDGGGDAAAEPMAVTDGARNPVAAGAEYTSLRAITRRAPRDPEYLVEGIDTSNVDLSWNALDSLTDPQGRPWKYPKTRTRAEGSNLEQFREEIETRTKDGQGCKAIAEILIEKGVDTSSRAVARMRMKWGLRQRAPRRMTQQGIANIRKAHVELAKRMANSDPVPVKRVRIRVMRKAEIVRMTKEGMTAAQIAENLSARGVQLNRGAATVERLRTVWGLLDDGPRSVTKIRATARAQALKMQKEQFENVARELGIEDVASWVKAKMDEDIAQDARRNYAYKLMGDAAPLPHMRRGVAHVKLNRPPNGPVGNGPLGNIFTGMPGVDFAPHVSPDIRPPPAPAPAPPPAWGAGPQGAAAAAAYLSAQAFPATCAPTSPAQSDPTSSGPIPPGPVPLGPAPLREVVDLSDDDEDDTGDDEVDEDMEHAEDAQETSASAEPPERTTSVQDSRSPNPSSRPEVGDNNSAPIQSPPALPRQNTFPVPHSPLPSSLPQIAGPAPPPAPAQVHNGVLDPALRRNGVFYTPNRLDPLPLNVPLKVRTAPPAGLPGRPPSLTPSAPPPMPPRPLAPRSLGSLGSLGPGRALAPRPIAPLPIPPSGPQRTEADYMGQFGMLPYPAPLGKPTQRYSTPSGLITTDGYEYLWAPPPLPDAPRPPPPAMQPGTDWILVPQPGPPAPPPAPHPVSRIPAPPLIIPEEEADAHEADHKTVEDFLKVGRECLEVLAARAENRLLTDSLTGLPPSLKDVQNAKERLRVAARTLSKEL